MAKKTSKKVIDSTKPKRTDVGYKRPPEEHKWKKGFAPNPQGSNPITRAMKQLTATALSEAIELVMTGTEAEIVAALKNPDSTIALKIILRASLDSMQHGNFDKFNTIIERVLGKVPNKIELESPKGTMSPTKTVNLKNLSDDELQLLQKVLPPNDNSPT